MQNLPSDELLATTLRAIGDGVISGDQKGSRDGLRLKHQADPLEKYL
jgi:hypothetical protein